MGIDFGHINSEFLKSKGVPEVDELEFFNDWQLRSNNRSNPKLVMQFTKNCGSCFDWFLEALTEEQKKNVEVRYWPAAKKFTGQINGIKTWVGTATFPEALWDNKAISNAVVANIELAKKCGADFRFKLIADQLIREEGRVTAIIAHSRDGEYFRFNGTKGVVLSAGDFASNEEMMRDLCDELVTLAPKDAKIRGGGRDGKGIRMGVWIGGRMAPGPIATMGGNTASPPSPVNTTASLWLDGDNKRYCNEGFGGDGVYSGLEGARLKKCSMVNLFDTNILDLLQCQAPVHGAMWVNNSEDPRMATSLQYIDGARKAGKEGFSVPDPHAPKNGKGGPQRPKLYCCDTLEELAECLGFDGKLKENMLESVRRYNELCYKGRDEDYGKDPSLMVPVATPPFFGMVSRPDVEGSNMMGPMVTVDGLWTDEYQNVYDDNLDVIPGLYATGNCCGRRFGDQYSTPVSGVSIGIAWTLGRELGKYLVAL